MVYGCAHAEILRTSRAYFDLLDDPVALPMRSFSPPALDSSPGQRIGPGVIVEPHVRRADAATFTAPTARQYLIAQQAVADNLLWRRDVVFSAAAGALEKEYEHGRHIYSMMRRAKRSCLDLAGA